MANRRMFDKDIIESDAFLEMPATTQMLYVHLSMHADDDGFVSNPKQITKMVCATTEDIDNLLTKRFIIQFSSGIIVIKHWLINNKMRGDRHKNSVYVSEKSQLFIKSNRAYSLDKTKGINALEAVVNQTTTKRKTSSVKKKNGLEWLEEYNKKIYQDNLEAEKQRQRESLENFDEGEKNDN